MLSNSNTYFMKFDTVLLSGHAQQLLCVKLSKIVNPAQAHPLNSAGQLVKVTLAAVGCEHFGLIGYFIMYKPVVIGSAWFIW